MIPTTIPKFYVNFEFNQILKLVSITTCSIRLKSSRLSRILGKTQLSQEYNGILRLENANQTSKMRINKM